MSLMATRVINLDLAKEFRQFLAVQPGVVLLLARGKHVARTNFDGRVAFGHAVSDGVAKNLRAGLKRAFGDVEGAAFLDGFHHGDQLWCLDFRNGP